MKEKHSHPLEHLYELARIHGLGDSYQLARLTQFLAIQNTELYPKTLLSEIIKRIDLSLFPHDSRFPYDVLASLNLPIYITTNYDRFLEESLSRETGKKPDSDFFRWNMH